MPRERTYVYESDEIFVYEGEDEVGDDYELWGNVRGGDDIFTGEDNAEAGYRAFGDAYEMEGPARGGDDTFTGGEDSGSGDFYDLLFGGEDIVFFAGDAAYMTDTSVGGNDRMSVGVNSTAALFGDAMTADARVVSGNDAIHGSDGYAYYGSNGSMNMLVGDAYAFGSMGGPRILSDMGDYVTPQVQGGKDAITGGSAMASNEYDGYAVNLMMGDAYAMGGTSKSGSDTIAGGDASADDDGYAGALNLATGDAFVMYDGSKGASDRITGGSAEAETGGEAYAINLMVGDAYAMFGRITGGNDTITGGSADSDDAMSMVLNLLVGDAFEYGGVVTFGSDRLVGGSSMDKGASVENLMYGDLGDLDGMGEDISEPGRVILDDLLGRDEAPPPVSARLGSDVLIGGAYAENTMYGDAVELDPGMRGGNDTIMGGGGEWSMNLMVGDADYMSEGSSGGRDMLFASAGEDMMFGDARYENWGVGGADTFVMSMDGGVDTIGDFSASERDRIDLRAFAGEAGFGSYRQIVTRLEQVDDDVYLDLTVGDAEAGVWLTGVTLSELTSRSFIF